MEIYDNFDIKDKEEEILMLLAIHKEAHLRGDEETCKMIHDRIDDIRKENSDIDNIFTKTLIPKEEQ